MSYLLDDANDETERWEIVFWTRRGQCASNELEALLRRLTDEATARLLLMIEEFAAPPRDRSYLCGVVEEHIEVYAIPVMGLTPRGGATYASLLLAAHLDGNQIYILGVEDREGQGRFSVCVAAKAEALQLHVTLQP